MSETVNPTVELITGANYQDVPLTGEMKTVRDVLQHYAVAMNIGNPDQVKVMRNGDQATQDDVVNPGDSIEFIRPAGSKGCMLA